MARTETRSVPTRRQVLVIDDAEVIRTYLQSLLPTRGYEVVLAADGPEALEMLEQGLRPDVIICDIMMPRMDGIETLRRIKAIDDSLPVIMLSVVGKATTIVEAMQTSAPTELPQQALRGRRACCWRCTGVLRDRRSLRAQSADRLRPAARARCPGAATPSSGAQRPHACATCASILEQVSDTDVTVLIQGESGVRQGDRRPHGARPLEPSQGPALREGELRRAAGGSARERALRLREGRLHGRLGAQVRQVRAREQAAPSFSTRSAR